jgi:hypothetical protein
MFKTDQDFIGRYKKSVIFVPQKVKQEVKPEVKHEVKQEVKQEMNSWAKKIVSSCNSTTDNSTTVVRDSSVSISESQISKVKEEVKEEVKEKKEQNALELIKAALAQISSALILLEGIIPHSESSSQILHQATDMTAAVAEITSATAVVAVDIQESHNDSLEIVEIVNSEVEPSEFIKKSTQKEDEFKTVIPKKKSKSKNTHLSLNLPALKKEDDFPSLGSSFSPIKKSGIWGEKDNKSLQIAKLIAHVPSPSPVSASSSPSPHLKKSGKLCRGGGGGAAVYSSEDDDYIDNDYSTKKSEDDWE